MFFLAACHSSATGVSAPPPDHYTDEYDLKELNGSYGAFSDGQSLQVFVAYLRNGAFLRVRGGKDTVTVDVNGTVVAAPETIEDGKAHYIATVAPPPTTPVVTITIARGADKVVMKDTLGPAFELVGPPPKISAGQTVSIDVTPHPDLKAYQTILGPALTHSLEVTGACVDGNYQKIPLTGQESYPLTWETTSLKLTGTTGCDLEVKVRMDTGASAPEPQGVLAGAGFEAAQSRKFATALTR
jgi:hypothetical protein